VVALEECHNITTQLRQCTGSIVTLSPEQVREAKAKKIVDGITKHANRYEVEMFVTISMFSNPINNFLCLCLAHLFRRQRDCCALSSSRIHFTKPIVNSYILTCLTCFTCLTF